MAATLLVAFGLQAGAVKILLNLGRQPDTMATLGARVLPMQPAAPTPVTAEVEQRSVTNPPSTALPASAPEPVSVISDPPPAQTMPRVEPPRHEPSPEASLPVTPVAPSTTLNDPPPLESSPPAAMAATTPSVAPPVESAITKPAETKPIEPATAGSLRDAAWLKTREPKNYTVQLYSGKDLDKLKEIAASTASTVPQAYFTTGSRSNPWYSLVVGDYRDGASARAAAAAISAQSAQIKPWVRRFDDIQTNLR